MTTTSIHQSTCVALGISRSLKAKHIHRTTMSEPTVNPPQSDNDLLNDLHLIDPQLASLKQDFSRLARCVRGGVAVTVYQSYLAVLRRKLEPITAMLADAGNRYMALIVGGGGCADKVETIEGGLWSLRRDHDEVVEGLGRVERRLGEMQ